MTPYYSDEWLTILEGDCRAVLPSLPADSVDCVVTSPPYWGLRDYGTATWVGGDEACDHKAPVAKGGSSTLTNWAGTSEAHEQYAAKLKGTWNYRDICGKCGATRQDSQLGLERTPEEYVANMVAVFAEVRRVLKPSGTCWLNLGDSYAAGGGSGAQRLDELGERLGTGGGKKHSSRPSGRAPSAGLAHKQLVGIPWRVAFALQADGWYLRSDIIWSKPNPMPESVTDRPTKAHEYLFLLTKSARYYFDADAVREAAITPQQFGSAAVVASGKRREMDPTLRHHGGETEWESGRNIRSVWSIATRPYPGAHFAVFPPELPERCIKAGSPEGGVVLDPFAGSGTVGLVANRLSRRAILIDLNPEYLRQQMTRNAQTPLGLGAA